MLTYFIHVTLLFSLVHCGPCPEGYGLSPNGEYCHEAIWFYDSFIGQYQPTTFDEAEQSCNSRNGGLIGSIHSEEEQHFVYSFAGCPIAIPSAELNIGIRCKGKDCKWDDGSPVTYTNFIDEPPEGTTTRCYACSKVCDYQLNCKSGWVENSCDKKLPNDCWVCSVRAKTIDCLEDETAYKGGCVSIQSSYVDHKTAEASCPNGGSLISIHSSTENKFYKNMALNAGLNGSIYIGGMFTNGVFEWSDGTHYGMNNWANSFPNTIFGTCTQMLLGSEFGSEGQWTNIDCNTKQPSICIRFGQTNEPTVPSRPQADAICPPVQYYTGSGNIISPNYPLSIPSQQTCEYVIGTMEGTRASIQFSTYDCHSGTSLALFDGFDSDQPFLTFTSNSPTLSQPYIASSNVMKVVFSANGTSAPVGTGWEAEFNGV